MKWVFKHQDFQMFGAILKHMSIFHPPEIVGRSSETQLHIVYIEDMDTSPCEDMQA